MIHFVEHHDEVSCGPPQHLPEAEQEFTQRKAPVRVAWVKLVQDSLCYPHACGSISAVHMSHYNVSFSREVPLQISAECFGQHGFPASNGSGDDGPCCSFRGTNGGEF
jgi:hypothetical protein